MSVEVSASLPRQGLARQIIIGSALIVVALMICTALATAAGLIAAPPQVLVDRLLPPGASGRGGFYLLGTDSLGRDMLTMLLRGTLPALSVSVAAVALAILIGVSAGIVAGYRGGAISDALLIITNAQLSFPFVLLAITVVGIFRPSVHVIIIVLALGSWVTFARVAHAEAKQIRDLEYLDAARVMNASTLRILLRHVLPNILPSILVLSTFAIGHVILGEAFLSFLGLGLPTQSPTWGRMLSDGRAFINTAWWLTFFPGLLLTLLILPVNILGEELRERLDPKLSN